MKIVLLAAALLAATAFPALAAERYPARPIRVIVPFPPGGSTDFNARAIQDRLSDQLGQQIVVDNRGGASGQIGTRLVKDSTPDGYTLVLHTIAFVTSPFLYDNTGETPAFLAYLSAGVEEVQFSDGGQVLCVTRDAQGQKTFKLFNPDGSPVGAPVDSVNPETQFKDSGALKALEGGAASW